MSALRYPWDQHLPAGTAHPGVRWLTMPTGGSLLGEAITHLHLLMHRFASERTLDEGGLYRFRSIDPALKRRSHPLDHDESSEGPMMVEVIPVGAVGNADLKW